VISSDFLPITAPFTTSIDIQISYFSGVRNNLFLTVVETTLSQDKLSF